MIEYVLWVAVALLVASAVLPSTKNIKFLFGGLGWTFFSVHWAYQPLHYLEINDYFNVILTLAIALFCLFLAKKLFVGYRSALVPDPSNHLDIVLMVTSATALGSLFYFPFANIPSLNEWIISAVTGNTIWMLHTLGYSVESIGNRVIYNDHTVTIILACTAIESIALFTGLIVSINAPTKKLLKAFMVSVPVIYSLNIIRNTFVIVAYGEQWFGPDSFEIAHHMIAKFGSGIALFVIAYIVMRILPELLDLIDGLWEMTTDQLKAFFHKL